MENPSIADLSANMPAIGSFSLFVNAVFGNTNFMVAPSQTGEVNFSFGQVPYYSLEGQLTMEQLLAPVQPTSILPGQNTGQQNISGQYTVTGPAGNVQVAIGNATNASGSF